MALHDAQDLNVSPDISNMALTWVNISSSAHDCEQVNLDHGQAFWKQKKNIVNNNKTTDVVQNYLLCHETLPWQHGTWLRIYENWEHFVSQKKKNKKNSVKTRFYFHQRFQTLRNRLKYRKAASCMNFQPILTSGLEIRYLVGHLETISVNDICHFEFFIRLTYFSR